MTASSPKAGADGVKRAATVTANLSEKARKGTVNGSTVRLVTMGSTKAVEGDRDATTGRPGPSASTRQPG